MSRRVVLVVAVALGVGLAVPVAALVRSRADLRSAQRDARVDRAAVDALLVVSEKPGRPGRLDTSIYEQTPRAAGAPLTAVLSRSGAVLVTDRDVPGAVRAAAAARARKGDDDPASAGGYRLAARSVEGRNGQIGTVVAYQRIATASDWVLPAAAALGFWLLLVGGVAWMVARAVGPARDAAAREEAFLADAAHELRTPLAVVQARVDRALREGATEADLRAIAGAVTGAADTITAMLELARLDTGSALGERERLRLDALVSTCAAGYAAPGVRVTVDAPEPVTVVGDERLLTRAVGNLVDNAVRHGGAGGDVRVSITHDNATAWVRVADNGPGIAPGQRDGIFERFHRGSAAAPGGAGLGLPIARLIAEAHGGTLQLEHAERGASFVLALPLSGR